MESCLPLDFLWKENRLPSAALRCPALFTVWARLPPVCGIFLPLACIVDFEFCNSALSHFPTPLPARRSFSDSIAFSTAFFRLLPPHSMGSTFHLTFTHLPIFSLRPICSRFPVHSFPNCFSGVFPTMLHSTLPNCQPDFLAYHPQFSPVPDW